MADTASTEQSTLTVQVCYALPRQSVLKSLNVAPGTSIAQAIEISGVLRQFPQIDLARQRVGIFGKLKTPDTVLRDGDRIEIYRPLKADPKETRRRRAAHRKSAQG